MYVVMLENKTELYGVNAANGALKGLTAVSTSASWKSMTAIINGTYGLDNTNDGGFFKTHRGEQYIRAYTDPVTSTHWDQTCSSKMSIVGGNKMNYFAYGGAGVFATGAGDVPTTTNDGCGSLPDYTLMAGSQKAFTLVARITVGTQKLLVLVVSEFGVGTVHADLQKGASDFTILHCDGGASVGLAVNDPGTTGMKVLVEGPGHSSAMFWRPYIKTYLAFKSTKPDPSR